MAEFMDNCLRYEADVNTRGATKWVYTVIMFTTYTHFIDTYWQQIRTASYTRQARCNRRLTNHVGGRKLGILPDTSQSCRVLWSH